MISIASTLRARMRVKRYPNRAGVQVWWSNPWRDAVPVPIEELARCHYGLGSWYGMPDGTRRILTVDDVLQHWHQCGQPERFKRIRTRHLDAYILPRGINEPDSVLPLNIGIRYSNEGSNYLSPFGDKQLTEELLKKYR